MFKWTFADKCVKVGKRRIRLCWSRIHSRTTVSVVPILHKWSIATVPQIHSAMTKSQFKCRCEHLTQIFTKRRILQACSFLGIGFFICNFFMAGLIKNFLKFYKLWPTRWGVSYIRRVVYSFYLQTPEAWEEFNFSLSFGRSFFHLLSRSTCITVFIL